MREIKFRAWLIPENKYIEQDGMYGIVREALESGSLIDKTWHQREIPNTVFPSIILYEKAFSALSRIASREAKLREEGVQVCKFSPVSWAFLHLLEQKGEYNGNKLLLVRKARLFLL